MLRDQIRPRLNKVKQHQMDLPLRSQSPRSNFKSLGSTASNMKDMFCTFLCLTAPVVIFQSMRSLMGSQSTNEEESINDDHLRFVGVMLTGFPNQ